MILGKVNTLKTNHASKLHTQFWLFSTPVCRFAGLAIDKMGGRSREPVDINESSTSPMSRFTK